MSDFTGLDVTLGWSGPILPIGRWAGSLDRRRFNDVTWPSLPLVLGENHESFEMLGPWDQAEILSVDEIAARVPDLTLQEREEIGDYALWASGRITPNEAGLAFAGQLAFWGRMNVSVEVRDGEFVETPITNDEGEMIGRSMDWTRTVVGAVAVERVPAFAGAWIRPDPVAAAWQPSEEPDEPEMPEDESAFDALRSEVDAYRQAGAGPHIYPARMFTKLDYGGPTRLTIGKDGEVTGHAVLWGKTHRANSAWTASRNPKDDLSEWLVGATALDDGSIIRTGVIVSDGLHGPAHQAGTTADSVRRMIESTADQVIAVNAWHDGHGIAVHGSTLPGVTVEQATRAMAGCPSVDERDLGDGRGFVTMGVLCVSTCGFTPASHVVTMEAGEPVRRLVASAALEPCGCGGECGCGVRAASGETQPAEPDDKPNVVDLGSLAKQDAEWRKARLKAAVAPKPR